MYSVETKSNAFRIGVQCLILLRELDGQLHPEVAEFLNWTGAQLAQESVRQSRIPVKLKEISIKLTKTPVELTETPIKLTGISIKLIEIAVNLTETSVKLTETPVKLTIGSASELKEKSLIKVGRNKLQQPEGVPQMQSLETKSIGWVCRQQACYSCWSTCNLSTVCSGDKYLRNRLSDCQ